MRTTLDIADDVLHAAKELARRERKTAGQVLSDLARLALHQPSARARSGRGARSRAALLGFEPFPSRGGLVTNEWIDRLREADGD
jgi:hypothetical protein